MDFTKFPFKSMLRIVDFLMLEKKEIPISKIQSISNACFSDTYEVTEMISFLTSFGLIKKTEKGWKRTHVQEFAGQKSFRMHYLETCVNIIFHLTSEPILINNLSKELQIGTNDLEKYLQFLEHLTSNGFVQKTEKGWKMINFFESTKTSF